MLFSSTSISWNVSYSLDIVVRSEARRDASILGLRITSTSNVLLFVTFLKELSSLILLFVGFGPILGRV